MMYSSHYSHPAAAQHPHSHNLFSTSQYPGHSAPYITPHPAPSPSPGSSSLPHHYGGVSLSPTLSHSPTHHGAAGGSGVPSSPAGGGSAGGHSAYHPPPQHHSVR